MAALDHFLAMGGYAAFIWPAFGIAAIILISLLIVSRRYWKAQAKAVAMLEKSRPRRDRKGQLRDS